MNIVVSSQKELSENYGYSDKKHSTWKSQNYEMNIQEQDDAKIQD
jgi:hypothetical protein